MQFLSAEVPCGREWLGQFNLNISPRTLWLSAIWGTRADRARNSPPRTIVARHRSHLTILLDIGRWENQLFDWFMWETLRYKIKTLNQTYTVEPRRLKYKMLLVKIKKILTSKCTFWGLKTSTFAVPRIFNLFTSILWSYFIYRLNTVTTSIFS